MINGGDGGCGGTAFFVVKERRWGNIVMSSSGTQFLARVMTELDKKFNI